MVRKSVQFVLLAIAFAAFIGDSQGSNILGIFPSLSPSHVIIQMSMAKALAEKGHNVTVVTILKPVVTHKSINVIQVPLTKEETQQISDTFGAMSKTKNNNMILTLLRLSTRLDFMFKKMADALKDDRVRDLYRNKDNKFDLVLSGYFMNDFQIAIAKKLNVPVIVVASMPPNQMLNFLIGNPLEVAYVPSMDSLEPGKGMSFLQRLTGYTTSVFFELFNYVTQRRNQKFYKDIFGDDPALPEHYSELITNISMVFFASHAASEGPIRPNVPAAVEIGGIQVKDTPDPLPKNMAEFLENATDGAILLSLGSNVQGSHIKPETVAKMFNVLSKLKQRVIWKWEDLENTPGKSDNILYSKWLPQDDILAHPKIKLFINHAGKGGITEAQYHGKPMLSLPVFGDQPSNADEIVRKGFGLQQSLLTLEEQPFHEAIMEILSNPQYTEKVAKFSLLYRDRPMTARQSAIYWTEYVIRHHGAAHLQSPLVHMNFIAAKNIDVYGFIAVVLLALILLLRAMVKFVYRKCVSKSMKVKTN